MQRQRLPLIASRMSASVGRGLASSSYEPGPLSRLESCMWAFQELVRERIPELAVLKTLGFTGGTVSVLVLVESLMLCLFAAAVGLILSAGAMRIVGSVLGPVKLGSFVITAGLLIAVVLAIISGLPPALRAQRLNIVDALAGR